MNNKIISSFHISKPNFTQRPSLNQEIGDYILKHTIGEGAFSKVKLAVHKPSNNIVAIKILEKVKILQLEDKTRVEREIKILKCLRHANIVHLYSVLQTDKSIYLIMEYIHGKELFDYIIENHLSLT